MTSLRDLAKKTKKSVGEQTDRVLDADIEKTGDNFVRWLKSLKPFWRVVLSALPVFAGILCFGNWMEDIGHLFNGEVPGFSGLNKHPTDFLLLFCLLLAGPTFVSKVLRRRLKLEEASFRFVVWCERLTYFTVVVMLFDHFTLGISALLAGFFA